MILRRRHAALLVVFALLGGLVVTVLGAGPAAACSCVGLSDAQALASADVVFSGTVRDGAPSSPSREQTRTFRVTVDESFKGAPGAKPAVRTATDSAACGVEFAQGDQVLVFATVGGPSASRPDELSANLCSGTRVLEGPVPDAVRSGVDPPWVACADAVDTLDTLPADFRPVAGAVALTPGPIGYDTTAGPPYFAKEGIGLRSGAAADVAVARRFRDRVSISWGQTPPGPVMRFTPCATADGARWLAFVGGFTVTGPVCVPLVVTAGKRTERIRVAIGRPCAPS